MREYELTVVYDLAVTEAGGPEASSQQLTRSVEARGGKVLRIDRWGRRRMAYPINRAIDGDYLVSRVELEPASVEPLEAALKIDERVYRHLIVRADELPAPVAPREPRPAPEATQSAAAAGAAIDTTAEAALAGASLPPAAPVTATEAVAAAAEHTAEALSEPAPAPVPAMDEPLRNTSPETSTTGFASKAAEENTGISVEDLESHRPTGPHTQQDSPEDETTA